MDVPSGFKNPSRSDLVCKLRKALYGLKQAPRLWHAKIDAFLIGELRFVSSPNDPCLYVRHSAQSIMLIALYVDDLLLAGNESGSIAWDQGGASEAVRDERLGRGACTLGSRSHTRPRQPPLYTFHKRSTLGLYLKGFACTTQSQCRRLWSLDSRASHGPIPKPCTGRNSFDRGGVLEIDISEMRSQDTCNTHVCKLSHSTHK